MLCRVQRERELQKLVPFASLTELQLNFTSIAADGLVYLAPRRARTFFKEIFAASPFSITMFCAALKLARGKTKEEDRGKTPDLVDGEGSLQN